MDNRRAVTVYMIACMGLGAAQSAPARAQDVIVYPAKGQSQEQQSRDRYECHSWAVQQTGYDPTMPQPSSGSSAPPPPQPAYPEQPTVGRTAVRGAALGAVGGAIGGDAGKGAAIGAATGGALGLMRRNQASRDYAAQQQAYAQQQQQAQYQQNAASSQHRASYNRAISACLTGRGYTVN
jgi:hypothetical protein